MSVVNFVELSAQSPQSYEDAVPKRWNAQRARSQHPLGLGLGVRGRRPTRPARSPVGRAGIYPVRIMKNKIRVRK